MSNCIGRGAPGGTTSTTGQSDVPVPVGTTPGATPTPRIPAQRGPTTDGSAGADTVARNEPDPRPADEPDGAVPAEPDRAAPPSSPAADVPAESKADVPAESEVDSVVASDPTAGTGPATAAATGSADVDDGPGDGDSDDAVPGDGDSDDDGPGDGDSDDAVPGGDDTGGGGGRVRRPAAPSGPADRLVAATVSRGRRTPLWAKALVALGSVLILLSAGTVVGLHLLANRYDKSVHKAELIDPGARVKPSGDGGGLVAPLLPKGVDGPLNFLLLGSDARDDNPGNGQRSDTIIIVHIPATLDTAYLISIPRDLRVQIPPDDATGFRGGRQKINAAFNFGGGGFGGFQLLSKTLNQLIDIKFDGAAIVNFDGFQAAVHLLGGVNMCVDQVTKSIHTGTVYQIGCQHLNAEQSLDYVRQRELLPEGDYDRQRHQQQFLKAIFQEAVNQGVATNPIKLDQLIRAVGSALTVDTNGVSLADLVFGLRGIDPASLVGIKLPSAPETIGGVSYVLPGVDADSLYQAIASDTLDDWVAANPSWVNSI